MSQLLNSASFAAALGIQPGTLRSHLYRFGHYYDIRPVKLPNRLLLWPADAVERLTGTTSTDQPDTRRAA